MTKKILILGVNGFIGSNLAETIINDTDWDIVGADLESDKLNENVLNASRMHFEQRDITQDTDWVNAQIAACDVVLPLVAIANPMIYVKDPLRIFHLDFEINLAIVRECARTQTRVVFPSTSEVYGMCEDDAFDEFTSPLVTGPIHKERWIYSTSKQMLDRVIYAYGKHEQLSYTLFRPFNWMGPKLDRIVEPGKGHARVLTQFISNLIYGQDIQLVGGGQQGRSFTYIDDGIDGLMKIIDNKDDCAAQKIFNLGNPDNQLSIRALAEMVLNMAKDYPAYAERAEKINIIDVDANTYYGSGYQDVRARVPAIHHAKKVLGWAPTINSETAIKKTLDYYLLETSDAY